jgi:hypothetical protein
MGPALPPAPPAIIRSVASLLPPLLASLEMGGLAGLGSMAAPFGLAERRPAAERQNFAAGFKLGPKTRGARDASRRSRANRRKR